MLKESDNQVEAFFRAHQSHIVNTGFVRKLAKDEGDSLLMTDKSIIPLARRRKEAFVGIMKDGGGRAVFQIDAR
ncbi:MAG: LytTR family transcriptional regulator DNA-binding domain-containing protein [Saprospiraceae bacterium]